MISNKPKEADVEVNSRWVSGSGEESAGVLVKNGAEGGAPRFCSVPGSGRFIWNIR